MKLGGNEFIDFFLFIHQTSLESAVVSITFAVATMCHIVTLTYFE